VQGSQSSARPLRVRSEQLPTESQVFEGEVLARAKRADDPPEEMPERHNHGKNNIGTIRIQLFCQGIHFCRCTTFWRGTSLSMIWVFPERRGRRNRRGGEVAKRPLEKIESSMTIIFELRVGATVALDRRSPLSSRWAAQYGLLPFQAGPEPIGSARNPKA